MNTYREMIYMIKDKLKISSDDSFFTNEHIKYLINKYRAFYIYKFYKSLDEVPNELKQTICVPLQKDFDCLDGISLKSKVKLPNTITVGKNKGEGNISLKGSKGFRYTRVSPERLPFTNSDDSLRNIVYFAIDNKNIVNVNVSVNSDFSYLEEIEVTDIFEDPSEADKLSCEKSEEEKVSCDYLDSEVKIDSRLQILIINDVTNDLSGSSYKPLDNVNNAQDDLSNSSVDNYLRNVRVNNRSRKDD